MVLTDDGYNVKTGPKVASIVNRWLGRERNLHILYHVRFWSVILHGKAGPISMRAGDQRLEISPIPAYVMESFGISDDQINLMDRLNEEAELIDCEIEEAVDSAIEKGLVEEGEKLTLDEDEILEINEDNNEQDTEN